MRRAQFGCHLYPEGPRGLVFTPLPFSPMRGEYLSEALERRGGGCIPKRQALDNRPWNTDRQIVPYFARRSWSTHIARVLRKQMTEPELVLWSCLRHESNWKFRRQEPIDRYVVDFVCYPKRLVIEVDGIQHADVEPDRIRDARLAELGFTVLRFWNGDVMTDLSAVLETIDQALRSRPDLHRNRPPRRRESN